MPVRLAVAVLATLLCAGCSGAPPAGQVRVQVGRATLTAEVADTPQARGVGLMDRRQVAVGTGMLFRYQTPSTGRYWMFHTLVPLTAVFARSGRVLGVVDMVPCGSADPSRCPTYGVAEPFDTVLEAAPRTLRGRVAVGDRLRLG